MVDTGAQEFWKTDLEPTVLIILTESERVSFGRHSAAYTAAYNYLWEGRKETNKHDKKSKDFYAQVQLFFEQYTRRIGTAAPSDDSALPGYYDTAWDRFCRGVRAVDRLLNYLNKDYVNRCRDEGHKDIVTVRNLAFNNWKTNVFEPLCPRLENTDETREARLATIRNLFASGELKAEKLVEMRFGTAHASV
ncbi:Cullin repeat-like-containing domain protein [Mycena haematopus]|nr:Cullin repeat-like-containing domain protein [Mycena haematopus]